MYELQFTGLISIISCSEIFSNWFHRQTLRIELVETTSIDLAGSSVSITDVSGNDFKNHPATGGLPILKCASLMVVMNGYDMIGIHGKLLPTSIHRE